MGVVFTGSRFHCLFFNKRQTMTLVLKAVTAENTKPLTNTDSNTAGRESKKPSTS